MSADKMAQALRDIADRHYLSLSVSEQASLVIAAEALVAHQAAPQQAGRADDQPVDKLDAERYRWLRDFSVPPHNFYLSVPVEFDGVRYTPDEVDSAIDAARAMLAARAEKGGT